MDHQLFYIHTCVSHHAIRYIIESPIFDHLVPTYILPVSILFSHHYCTDNFSVVTVMITYRIWRVNKASKKMGGTSLTVGHAVSVYCQLLTMNRAISLPAGDSNCN